MIGGASISPWFFGPFGWVCERPVLLGEPIAARGAQMLWSVPSEARDAIERQLAAGVCRPGGSR